MKNTFEGHVARERAETEARLAAPPAPLCRWCGKTEIEHKPEFRQGAFGPPQQVERLRMKMPCLGWREHFDAKVDSGICSE